MSGASYSCPAPFYNEFRRVEQAQATSKTFQTLGKRTIRASAANNFLPWLAKSWETRLCLQISRQLTSGRQTGSSFKNHCSPKRTSGYAVIRPQLGIGHR